MAGAGEGGVRPFPPFYRLPKTCVLSTSISCAGQQNAEDDPRRSWATKKLLDRHPARSSSLTTRDPLSMTANNFYRRLSLERYRSQQQHVSSSFPLSISKTSRTQRPPSPTTNLPSEVYPWARYLGSADELVFPSSARLFVVRTHQCSTTVDAGAPWWKQAPTQQQHSTKHITYTLDSTRLYCLAECTVLVIIPCIADHCLHAQGQGVQSGLCCCTGSTSHHRPQEYRVPADQYYCHDMHPAEEAEGSMNEQLAAIAGFETAAVHFRPAIATRTHYCNLSSPFCSSPPSIS
ncbi:hypothetical protein M406DRAFT_75790 [Cryphonectria parasitica EP155]|uniref:Uncharacterized protein n=1 Tax=Cryphonectria parasitica (strain ATCC 38755 / EP155) TaxID=660469 RepID=A0A9P5CSH6_CRYP1|nr:uncharacterized protein M406DRAFT_75790 [Cryphonectria parasitica EP155]KAF3769308.1 hypothetical protein M406DRAFT_75790 [Cryphonectria parasitica EP155]